MKMNSAEFGGSEAAPDLEGSSVTEWTNEKHSSYLQSIEASFVNQLYDSLDYPGQNSSFKKPRICSSTQFKVLQEGLWHKVSFENPKHRFSKVDELRSVVTSPWIRGFRSASSKLNGCQTRSLKEIEALTEVSDQNFVDEAIGHGNAEGKRCSNGSKRMRSTSVNAKTSSSFDQVVPL